MKWNSSTQLANSQQRANSKRCRYSRGAPVHLFASHSTRELLKFDSRVGSVLRESFGGANEKKLCTEHGCLFVCLRTASQLPSESERAARELLNSRAREPQLQGEVGPFRSPSLAPVLIQNKFDVISEHL